MSSTSKINACPAIHVPIAAKHTVNMSRMVAQGNQPNREPAYRCALCVQERGGVGRREIVGTGVPPDAERISEGDQADSSNHADAAVGSLQQLHAGCPRLKHQLHLLPGGVT